MGVSRRQMFEMDKAFHKALGSGNRVYSTGVYDGSRNAYVIRNGKAIKFKTNAEAYAAACKMMKQ